MPDAVFHICMGCISHVNLGKWCDDCFVYSIQYRPVQFLPSRWSKLLTKLSPKPVGSRAKTLLLSRKAYKAAFLLYFTWRNVCTDTLLLWCWLLLIYFIVLKLLFASLQKLLFTSQLSPAHCYCSSLLIGPVRFRPTKNESFGRFLRSMCKI